MRMKQRQQMQNNFMENLKKSRWILTAVILTAVFITFTLLVRFFDIQTDHTVNVGCATINFWWRDIIGVQKTWKIVSDIIAFVAILLVGVILAWQFLNLRYCKKLNKLPTHWWFLDLALIVLLVSYCFFQILIINYRPFIAGVAEAAYPSSHILLLATVCPLVIITVSKELKAKAWRFFSTVLGLLIMSLGIVARVLSGYHWLTDSIGGILLGSAIVAWYQFFCTKSCQQINN